MNNNNEPFSLFVSKLNFLAVSAEEASITMEEFIVKFPELEEVVRDLDQFMQLIMNLSNSKSFGSMESEIGYFEWWPILTSTLVGGALIVAGEVRKLLECRRLIKKDLPEIVQILKDKGILIQRVMGWGQTPGPGNNRHWHRTINDLNHTDFIRLKNTLNNIRNIKDCFKKNKKTIQNLLTGIRDSSGALIPGLEIQSIAQTALVLISTWIATEAMFIWEVILRIPENLTLSPDWLNSFAAYVIETSEGVVPESVINVITGAGELIEPHQAGIVSAAAFVILAVPAMASGMVVAPLAAVDAALYYLFGWGLAAGAITIGSGGG